jgi:hypothetical protein
VVARLRLTKRTQRAGLDRLRGLEAELTRLPLEPSRSRPARNPARLLPDRLSRAPRDRSGATGLAAFGPPCSTRESGSPDLLDLDDGWAARLGMPAEGAVRRLEQVVSSILGLSAASRPLRTPAGAAVQNGVGMYRKGRSGSR